MTNSSNTDKMIYLNNAGQAPLSKEVQKVGVDAIGKHPADDCVKDCQDDIRQLFEKLIQVPSSQNANTVAIHPSAAFAVTLAARNILRLKNDDGLHSVYRVVVVEDQHASAVYPWKDIVEETGSENSNSRIQVKIHTVQRNDKEYDGWTRAILETLSDETTPILAVCLPPLHWSDGTLIDLKLIGTVCKQKKVPLIVDATQGERTNE